MFYWYAEPVFPIFFLKSNLFFCSSLYPLPAVALVTSRKNLFCVMTFTSDVWWSDLYLNELKWHLLQQGEKVIFKRFSCYMCDFSIYIIPVQKWSIQYIKIGFLVSVYAKYHCVVSSRGLLIIIFKAQCSALWLCKQQRLSPPHSSNRPQESVTLWKKRKTDFSPVCH